MIRTEFGIVPLRSSSVTADGTVFSKVPQRAVTGRSMLVSARIIDPPEHKGINNSNTDKSKQMDVDAITATKSSASNSCRAQDQRPTALCAKLIPLGRPVDPDV